MSEDDKKKEAINTEVPIELMGADVGRIVILPKGHNGANPVEQLSRNLLEISELKHNISELTKTKDELSKKNEELEKNLKDTQDKLNTLENTDVKVLAEQIVDSRIKAKLSTVDNKDKDVESFMGLGKDKLSMLKADYEQISKDSLESAGRTNEKLQAGETDEDKIKKMRMSMFGHEKTLDETESE